MKKNRPPASISRRHALQTLGAMVGAAAIAPACGGNDAANASSSSSAAGVGGAGGSGAGTGGAGTGGTGGGVPACADTGGLTPAELLANIDTIVVLMMENRSFDHYFGSMKLLEGREVDGLTGTESNPDGNGMAVPVWKLDAFTQGADPPHGWDASHAQFNGGLNDGFVTEHAGMYENEVMGYYIREQLPITHALADAYVLCERWFCSVMGPTWPNRFYLHAATSQGVKSNTGVMGLNHIFTELDAKGISNMVYYHDLPFCGAYGKLSGITSINDFFTDAAAGMLPQFCMIDPGYNSNDDHPVHDVRLGQALIASVFSALASSPQWDRCLFILTYDENGGFYDHVPPPGDATDDNAEFRQLGFRVPSLVCGPHVRKGCVSSTRFDHVSVLATLTKKWNLTPLNARVSATNDLSICIDPAYVNDPQPAPQLPVPPMPLKQLLRRVGLVTSQPELSELADRGIIPRHLDLRGDSVETVRRVLRRAADLGAIRLLD